MSYILSDFDLINPGRIIITGATGGTGRAIATILASSGLDLVLCARKANPDFEIWVSELETRFGVKISINYFDFEIEEVVAENAKSIVSQQDIAGLVNCAGSPFGAKITMTRIQDLKKIFNVNFFNQVLFTQYVFRKMISQNRGSIVNIASKSGVDPNPGTLAYGASKAALIHFTKVLAAEASQYNIRVNCINPGAIETNMLEQMEQRAKQKLIQSSGMGRAAKPSEIGDVVTFLLSNHSSYISGQIINVDGGIQNEP